MKTMKHTTSNINYVSALYCDLCCFVCFSVVDKFIFVGFVFLLCCLLKPRGCETSFLVSQSQLAELLAPSLAQAALDYLPPARVLDSAAQMRTPIDMCVLFCCCETKTYTYK